MSCTCPLKVYAIKNSLTGVTALWSLSKTHLSKLSTGSTQEDPSRITERLLSGRKESNQTNKQTKAIKNIRELYVIRLPGVIFPKALFLQDECFGKNYSSFLDFTLNYEQTSGIFVPWSHKQIACVQSPTIDPSFTLQSVDLTLCMLGNFTAFCRLLIFSKNIFFETFFSGIPSDY